MLGGKVHRATSVRRRCKVLPADWSGQHSGPEAGKESMALWNSRGRSVATVASIVALTASGTMAVNAALAPDPINGCVSKLTGGVRIPGAGQTCNALENPLSWNNSGPAGPAGAQGPQGVQGGQGAQGERGPAG